MNTNDITCGDIFVPGSAFAQCHASTVAALPGNRLIAAWFGGTAEKNPDTAIWVSRFDGAAWSAPGYDLVLAERYPGMNKRKGNRIYVQ